MKRRKLMIVVEEDGTEDGKGFTLSLQGDKDRLQKNISEDEMSSAEYWAMKLFQICVGIAQEAGVIKTINHRPVDREIH